MFKFKDLSNTEDELFRPENYQLSVKDFFAKRRTAKRVYLFDLRGAGDYEISICLVRIIFQLSTSRIQSIKCLSLETFYFTVEG